MRILALVSTLDFKLPHGATPFIIQFLIALQRHRYELTVIPYRGKAPPPRSYPFMSMRNPIFIEAEIGYLFSKLRTNRALRRTIDNMLIKLPNVASSQRLAYFINKLLKIKNFDIFLIIGIPICQIIPVLYLINRKYNIPILFYDVDFPTTLPEFGGFSSPYYSEESLQFIDDVIVPCEGSIVSRLYELGASRIRTLHFAVDKRLYNPEKYRSPRQDIDVFFFGDIKGREEYVDELIRKPQEILKGTNFVILSRIDGKFSDMIKYYMRSKICLNITRKLQALTYTSTSRPFEMAALRRCIISSEHRGLEKWFKVGKDLFIVNNADEAIEIYQWLLYDKESRESLAYSAYKHFLEHHTIDHRIEQFSKFIRKVTGRYAQIR